MNCHPGDLALVVGGFERNIGKVVHCLKLLSGVSPYDVVPTSDGAHVIKTAGVWCLDTELEYRNTGGAIVRAAYAKDCYLMPIRPNARVVERERAEVVSA